MSFENSKRTIGSFSYLLGDKIGDGCSSEVYRGINEKNRQPVAIKVIHKLNCQTKDQLEMAQAEITALQALKDCQNVLKLKQVLQTKNSIYIVTELCEKGTLSEVLSRERKLPEDRAIGILQQIINGYKSIHGQNLIHRDIKPSNIFVGEGDSIRIGDFGFAINAAKSLTPSFENLGSPIYMPIESLVENQYSFKSDIWGIGVTFYQMLTGRTPWKSNTEKELIKELQYFKVDGCMMGKVTEKSLNFLRRVLVKDVKDRMSPEEMFSYSFASSSSSKIQEEYSGAEKSEIQIQKHVTFSSNQAEKNLKNLLSKTTYADYTRDIKQSGSSTQEHSGSKDKFTQNMHYLREPKQRVASSALVPSPKTTDKKLGGSLLSFQDTIQKQNNLTFTNHKEIPQKSIIGKIDHKLKCKSDDHEQKINSKIQRTILTEVHSQINYFRFLFKLAKKINQIIKTNDQIIKQLKQKILYLTHLKISDILSLKGLSYSGTVVDSFRTSQDGLNLQKVLKLYSQRYRKEEEKLCLTPASSGQELKGLINYCLKVLYQNIAKSQGNTDTLSRKKGLILIAEDMIELRRLHALDAGGNWATFHQDSGIDMLLDIHSEVTESEESLKKRWEGLKGKIRKAVTL